MHMTTINTYWAVVANASHKNELGDQITRRGGIATGGKHFIFLSSNNNLFDAFCIDFSMEDAEEICSINICKVILEGLFLQTRKSWSLFEEWRRRRRRPI